MGAWEATSFGNDSALDWVSIFQKNQIIDTIIEAFEEVKYSQEYIDSDVGSEALAAAEILAAIKGNKAKDFPGYIDLQVSKIAPTVQESHYALAIDIVKKVFLSDSSELRDLWEGQQEFDLACQDLLERLS